MTFVDLHCPRYLTVLCLSYTDHSSDTMPFGRWQPQGRTSANVPAQSHANISIRPQMPDRDPPGIVDFSRVFGRRPSAAVSPVPLSADLPVQSRTNTRPQMPVRDPPGIVDFSRVFGRPPSAAVSPVPLSDKPLVTQAPVTSKPLPEADMTDYDLDELIRLMDRQLQHWYATVISQSPPGWPPTTDLYSDSADTQLMRARLRRAITLVRVLESVRDSMRCIRHGTRATSSSRRATVEDVDGNYITDGRSRGLILKPPFAWHNGYRLNHAYEQKEEDFVNALLDPRTKGEFDYVDSQVDPGELLPYRLPYGADIGWNIRPEIDWFNDYVPSNDDEEYNRRLKRRRLEPRRLLDPDKIKLQTTAGQLLSSHALPAARVTTPDPDSQQYLQGSAVLGGYIARALNHKRREDPHRVVL